MVKLRLIGGKDAHSDCIQYILYAENFPFNHSGWVDGIAETYGWDSNGHFSLQWLSR